MSDNIFGTMPDKLYLVALLTILRQCVDPQYRNYYSPYATDVTGRPTDHRFFGKPSTPDPIIVLAQRIDGLAKDIETADPDGLPDEYSETCQLYNRWYMKVRSLRPQYEFWFTVVPEAKPPEEPEFNFENNNSTGSAPPVPYPAPTTAADEATRSRLRLDSRYASGDDRYDIQDRLNDLNN